MDERQITRARQNSAGTGWINIVLGIWVILSPFVLTFSRNPRAMWTNVATGIAVAIIGLIRASEPEHPGWSWTNVILGIWLLLSPFVLGFFSPVALWNNVIVGVIIASVAWGNAITRVHAVT